MRLFCKVILGILVVQLAAQSAFTEDYGRQFDRPMNGQASGMSFRKGELRDIGRLGAGSISEEDMMTKGRMMTEPSMSGLTYQVHVLGEVRNPGTYRITASDRLSEVLLRAGGVDEQGSQRNLEVRRKGEGVKKTDLLSFQIFGDLSNNPYLLDNDVIYVPLRNSTIQVVGAVKRPRDYELKAEKTLVDAITLAGGFSVGAALGSSIRVVRFVNGKKEVFEVASNATDMSNFELQNGDVVFVPHMITEKNKFDYDIPKLPGDNIFYPSYEDRVFILGGVAMPGAYPFNPYYNLSQYLSLAGGTTKMATGKMSLVSSDGKKRRLNRKEKDTVVINPGDTLMVDWRRIAPEGWLGIISSVTTLGLVALSLSDRNW
jgi:protein involved in polysaccharide export with SLBB domain